MKTIRKKRRKQASPDNYKGWKIRYIIPPEGATNKEPYWLADNCDRADRKRKGFKTKEDTIEYIDTVATEDESFGKTFSISDELRTTALKLQKDCGGIDGLKEAVKFWKQHNPSGVGKTISEMAALWLEYQTRANYRAATIRLNKHRMSAFADALGGDTSVSSVTRQQALQFIANREGGELTKRGWRSVLHAFFEFCRGDDESIPPIPQVIDFNPLTKKRQGQKKTTMRDMKSPAVWDAKTVQRFMWKCEELHPDDCAAFAVLFWAGLRPSELGGTYGIEAQEVTAAKEALRPFTVKLLDARKARKEAEGTPGWHRAEAVRAAAEQVRKPLLIALHEARKSAKRSARLVSEMASEGLRWEDINLKGKTIHVRPETSKMRRERYVDVSPNLATWLLKYRGMGGPVAVSPPTLKRHRQAIMAALDIAKWPEDVARHSFASFHLARHNNIANTQLQMGHSGDAGVLFKHYRKAATKAEAKMYWAVVPNTTAGEDHSKKHTKQPGRKEA